MYYPYLEKRYLELYDELKEVKEENQYYKDFLSKSKKIADFVDYKNDKKMEKIHEEKIHEEKIHKENCQYQDELIKELKSQISKLESKVEKLEGKLNKRKKNNSIIKSKEYKQFRETVLKRDNYKCQQCGSTTRLQVHHIKPKNKYPELIMDLPNCITLCINCHSQTDSFFRGVT